MKIEIIRSGDISFDENEGLIARILIGGANGTERRVVSITCGNTAETKAFVERQDVSPEGVPELENALWAFRGLVYNVFGPDQLLASKGQISLLIRNAALKEEQEWQRIERSVTAAERLAESSAFKREPISEDVRMFVWRRDQGRCTKCGSNEKLEFDHVIPVSKGGSNTARNIQLLCEPCNRSKSASI